MSVPTLPGVTARTITSERLATRVLFTGPDDGIPVLFLHGNLSSATWWEQTMVALPSGFRGIAPDQRGYGDADSVAKIDATRGVGDLVDDAIALLGELDVERAHLVANSLGGLVAWGLLAHHSRILLSVTLADPGSPYGFGATRDEQGTPTWDDFAGSGAGLINPEVVRLISKGNDTLESPFTVRSALRSLVVKPPFVPDREDELVAAMLSTHIGDQDYPGDAVPSKHWPGAAPGRWGPNNMLSPKYLDLADAVVAAEPKPSVVWVRGDSDLSVSDSAMADPGTLGGMGLIPGYPGAEVYPPQPMVAQTRAVLDRYAEAGGSYREVVVEETGHVPFIEKPDEFNEVLHAQLRGDH
jgi:pimeloyl-ACP methyl ester carboxylesterase